MNRIITLNPEYALEIIPLLQIIVPWAFVKIHQLTIIRVKNLDVWLVR